MKKLLFLSLVMTVVNSVLFAQSKELRIDTVKNLLFFVNSDKQVGLPIIEEILKGLRFTDKEQKVFNEVRSMNVYSSGGQIRKEISKTVDYYFRGASKYDDSIIQDVDNSIRDKFFDNDLFLFIDITEFNNLLEYQLVLFKFTLKNYRERGVMKVNVTPNLEAYRSTSVFVDLSRPNFKKALEVGIKSIIKEANNKPKPLLLSLTHEINGNNIFVAIGDTLQITAGAIDDDTHFDDLNFNVLVGDSNEGSSFKYVFSEGLNRKIIFNSSGTIQISITVTDGISEPQKRQYNVFVKDKPRFDEIRLYRKANLFNTPPDNRVFFAFSKLDIYSYLSGSYNDWIKLSESLQFTLLKNDSFSKIKFRIKEMEIGNSFEEINTFPYPTNFTSFRQKDSIFKKLNPYTFSIFIDSSSDKFMLVPPKEISSPESFELNLMGINNGILGAYSPLRLHFHKIRRLSLFYGLENSFSYGGQLMGKFGVSYKFNIRSIDYSIYANQGYYLGGEVRDNISVVNFQEFYFKAPIPTNIPISYCLGIRNNNFNKNASSLNFESTSESFNYIYYLVGAELNFNYRLYTQSLFINWAVCPSKNAPFGSQISIGTSGDFFFRKKKGNKLSF